MRERELAELMFRMAAHRGVDAEAAADEIASIALPSFVDAQAFRGAVIQALESSLRAQVEERLQSIRRKFDMAPAAPTAPASAPTPTPFVASAAPIQSGTARTPTPDASMDGLGDLADATITDFGTVVEPAPAQPAAPVEEEMPADATMVWTTRHG